MKYFPESHTHKKNKIEVELDLSNYSTTSSLKIVRNVDKSGFAKRS